MNNEQVGHAFAYGDSGKGSNFESNGTTLWSYGSVLAVRVEGMILVSNHIANYSPTSQRHASHMWRGIGYGTGARQSTITLYKTEPRDYQGAWAKEHWKTNVKYEIEGAIEAIKEYLVKQSRARTTSYFDQIRYRVENIEKLINTFGVDKRLAVYKEFLKLSDVDALEEDYADVIETFAKAQKLKAQKEINARHKKRVELIMSKTGMPKKWVDKYTKAELANYDFLYTNKTQLCTTAHVCVDLREARVLYKAMKAGKNVIGKKIGYYTILKHNDKMVKIGCHNILIKELERIFDHDKA